MSLISTKQNKTIQKFVRCLFLSSFYRQQCILFFFCYSASFYSDHSFSLSHNQTKDNCFVHNVLNTLQYEFPYKYSHTIVLLMTFIFFESCQFYVCMCVCVVDLRSYWDLEIISMVKLKGNGHIRVSLW